jgi:hypothetical protein
MTARIFLFPDRGYYERLADRRRLKRAEAFLTKVLEGQGVPNAKAEAKRRASMTLNQWPQNFGEGEAS